ncbi:MAG: hypothetical protein CMB16_00410 [Euryarchaeota archaeon]|nr:hypothetical protein [Euryarchaeota archaeon]|tara:strand:+ start:6132 stop:6536 length:405 start_codon:yes stop_codon:yes gene_type:complete
MWNLLISPLANLAGTYLQGKVDEKKANSEVKVALAKAKATVYTKEATSQMLNEESLTNQMAGSWKDEFWTLIFGSILLACFLPFSQEYVKEGFIFLNEHCPPWFQNCLYISIGASFGYRFGKQGLQMINKRGSK